MLKLFRKLVKYTSSSKGAKVTVVAWLAVVLILSIFLPSSKDYEQNSSEGSTAGDRPSETAQEIMDKEFPTDDGLTALLVFNRENKITDQDREKITAFSKWLSSDEKPEHVASALPYHEFPKEVQDQMFSEDGTTLLFNVAMEDGIDSDQSNEALTLLRDKVDELGMEEGMQLEITGPAGITADTIALFQDADVVLILSTVALIFILLLLIYRSPLLAITPLIIAGMVYGVVDRVLGLAGENNWFAVDSSAVSIMLVLLFAVLTDYSLFVFSRYKEELRNDESKYSAMGEAIHHVAEPIVFSGGTIFLAMLTLFVTVFEPYHHFAPVFSIAVIFIFIAGLTLIPALFALMGRKAFWPFIPKVDKEHKPKKRFWTSVGKLVKKHPAIIAGTLLIVMLIGVFNVMSMKFSFNLLKSFPEDISSRQGFEILEENYPAGQLAPVTVILHSDQKMETDQAFLESIKNLEDKINSQDGVNSISPEITEDVVEGNADLPRDFLAESEKSIKLQITLEGNPYETDALNTVENLRDEAGAFINNSGLSAEDYDLHFAGQTAEQLDVKQMNQRDMIFLFSFVVVLLTIVLGFQTKSILMPVLMMGTILLSYVATLGFGWWIFEHLFGYDAISYRLPVYTFVFMVALGIDYNIMLVSRIKEKARHMPWKEAVSEGVALTGGVISSAGLILAATFSVLMTQPLQELFLFGFIMAMGIILDTFLIRGFFLPSILTLTNFQVPGTSRNLSNKIS
ncbi:MMPL family transporter [Virgibacillus alimentarius]|uniref:RND superfamily putative drug exporter n=1 Tax=Virgibacillus alimentarius TaxID=698769 RepID=A0ABS4S9B7_9BACI|nr:MULTISPECIES: MMPL family transporter [Virgibacillus]MBP2258101.1 RND superfamily putative drug exporter [Virgibacillus alimentarius]HLR69154.1 MMPL family transporter [Virgibacillus sp.]